MPEIEGYHPICCQCGDDNREQRYKWCPACWEEERIKRDGYNRKGGHGLSLVNPCGMGYVETVRADGPKDTLPPEGIRVRPGHAEGWWEIV